MLFGRAFGTAERPPHRRRDTARARPAVEETVRRTETGGHVLPVVERLNPRARRLSLRIDGARDAVVLTLPEGVSRRAAEAFLAQHADWAAEHLARRLTDHLKAEARAAIKPAARALAARIDRTPGRITIRDQRTRWGSCTAAGGLNFSWRLILCPPEILEYVVAHEVAHLRHMDHSPAFWHTLATLVPNPERSRAWLRAHGERLHRIG